MVWLHYHDAVVAGEITEPTGYQYAQDFAEHFGCIGYVFINVGTNDYVYAVIGVLQLHGIAMRKIQILFLECGLSVCHCRLIDIYS